MTKREFVEKFHLIKTQTMCCFSDGLERRERKLYVDKYGRLFCFYHHDLFAIRPFEDYVEGMENLSCRLGAGYSWYH